MAAPTDFDFLIKDHIHICKASEACFKLENPYKAQRWPFFAILFSAGEDIFHCIENEKIAIPKSHFLFIGPDRYHAFLEGENENLWIVIFDYGFYARTPADAYFIQNTPLFFDQSKIYLSSPSIDIVEYVRLQLVYMQALLGQLGNPMVVDILHNAVQAMLLRSTFYHQGLITSGIQRSNQEDKKIATRFREILHLNFHQAKKLDFYADELGISPRRLNQAIITVHGRSAKQLTTEKIFEEAKSLLGHSVLTIKEISYRLGFTEENNFSAFFTKHAGYSPKKYRNLQNSLAV